MKPLILFVLLSLSNLLHAQSPEIDSLDLAPINLKGTLKKKKSDLELMRSIRKKQEKRNQRMLILYLETKRLQMEVEFNENISKALSKL